MVIILKKRRGIKRALVRTGTRGSPPLLRITFSSPKWNICDARCIFSNQLRKVWFFAVSWGVGSRKALRKCRTHFRQQIESVLSVSFWGDSGGESFCLGHFDMGRGGNHHPHAPPQITRIPLCWQNIWGEILLSRAFSHGPRVGSRPPARQNAPHKSILPPTAFFQRGGILSF